VIIRWHDPEHPAPERISFQCALFHSSLRWLHLWSSYLFSQSGSLIHCANRLVMLKDHYTWVFRGPVKGERRLEIPGGIYSGTRVDPWARFWRGGNEVYRPYAHALVYMLKEKKFREHFRDNNWRILIFQPAKWLPSNIWLSSLSPITTPVFTDFTPAPSMNKCPNLARNRKWTNLSQMNIIHMQIKTEYWCKATWVYTLELLLYSAGSFWCCMNSPPSAGGLVRGGWGPGGGLGASVLSDNFISIGPEAYE